MSSRHPAAELGAWQRVADGVWTLVAEPEHVNLGLVAGSERALLIDTGSTPAQGAQLLAAAVAVSPVPVELAVVTHWHFDHAFGLAGLAGLETIGHETIAGRLRSDEAAAEAAKLGIDPADLAAPGLSIAVARGVDLGGRRVELAHLGRGHTDGDLVVVVPDADVIFAGDLIESSGPPAFGPDSVGVEWAGTLDGLIGLLGDHSVVVPGHGKPVDRYFVFEQRGRIAAQAAEAQRPAAPPGRQLPLV